MNLLRKLFGSRQQVDTTTNKTGAEWSGENLFAQAIDIFYLNFEKPDRIRKEIHRLTASREDADLIYLFIPHFFCQMLLPEITYTDYYIIESDDRTQREIKFEESQLLTELFAFIKSIWEGYVKRDCIKVLFHSGDFRAANEALRNGANLEELQALPPTVKAI